MKTLNILFSEPDVFSVLPDDYPKKEDYMISHFISGATFEKKAYDIACEQSKANAIRIENPELLNGVLKSCGAHSEFAYPNKYGLKHGQIFQVEGFEYEVKTESCNGTLKADEILCSRSQIEFPDCCGSKRKVAILKLAKGLLPY